jgi:predicted ATPase
MLKTLRIENFRCFQTFELQQLGQLNLLVGMNNSGKTSILEAIQLLTAQLNLEALREVMLGRGEYIWLSCLWCDKFNSSVSPSLCVLCVFVVSSLDR